VCSSDLPCRAHSLAQSGAPIPVLVRRSAGTPPRRVPTAPSSPPFTLRHPRTLRETSGRCRATLGRHGLSTRSRRTSMPQNILTERLDAGPVLCAEGFLFELERRGYLTAGEFVPEVALEHPE